LINELVFDRKGEVQEMVPRGEETRSQRVYFTGSGPVMEVLGSVRQKPSDINFSKIVAVDIDFVDKVHHLKF